jgi:hypothetical protein
MRVATLFPPRIAGRRCCRRATSMTAPALRCCGREQKMPIFYSEAYTVSLPTGHRFPMERYVRTNEVLRAALAQLPRLPVVLLEPPPATEADVALAHTPEFVAAYCHNTLSEAAHKKIGFPWSPDFVHRTMMITGGTIAATISALTTFRRRLPSAEEGQSVPMSRPSAATAPPSAESAANDAAVHTRADLAAVSSASLRNAASARQPSSHAQPQHSVWVGLGGVACNQAGGTHHAFADAGEGFCIFNDIAVAARWVLGPGSAPGSGVHAAQYLFLSQQICPHSGPSASAAAADTPRAPRPPHPFAWPATVDLGIRRILVLDLDVHQVSNTKGRAAQGRSSTCVRDSYDCLTTGAYGFASSSVKPMVEPSAVLPPMWPPSPPSHTPPCMQCIAVAVYLDSSCAVHLFSSCAGQRHRCYIRRGPSGDHSQHARGSQLPLEQPTPLHPRR